MKKIHIVIAGFVLGCSALSLSGCGFLDVNPEMGLSEEEVFSYYNNTWSYFSQMYKQVEGQNVIYGERKDYRQCWALCNNLNSTKINFDYATPSGVAGRGPSMTCDAIRRGAMASSILDKYTFSDDKALPILGGMLKIIRICNMTISHIDMLKDAKEDEVNDLLGQAYFMRAHAHFCIARLFGGWPYLDRYLTSDDEWDIARLPLYETYRRCAEDYYTAYEYLEKAGKMRRDTYPGTPGHLQVDEAFIRPNGTVALVMRGRCLLYAASPLANPEKNKQYWEDAALANALALKVALEQRYSLQSKEDWRDNFVEVSATNENIWQLNYYTYDMNNHCSWLLGGQAGNSSVSVGLCPTQNYVDKFETIWGEPLTTAEEREAATEAGHYNETGDPYSNRDPRLEMTVLHDGSKTKYGIVINMYKTLDGEWPQSTTKNTTAYPFAFEWGTNMTYANGYSRTGYAAHKYWRGTAVSSSYTHLDGIRLAEVYLNYAEAANECGGPSAMYADAGITAEQAVNVIRNRMGMPDVKKEYTGSKEEFRKRIHNERQVEFAYEGNHNFFDLRRWVDDAKKEYTEALYGMYVTEVEPDDEHPHARNYERRKLPDAYQTIYGWQDYMNYFPIPLSEARKLKNFVNNEIWPVK